MWITLYLVAGVATGYALILGILGIGYLWARRKPPTCGPDIGKRWIAAMDAAEARDKAANTPRYQRWQAAVKANADERTRAGGA